MNYYEIRTSLFQGCIFFDRRIDILSPLKEVTVCQYLVMLSAYRGMI